MNMGLERVLSKRALRGPLPLLAIGVVCLILLWQTGVILFFWGGFIGVVGGLLKWRFSYPSAGNTETEHQVYRSWR